MINPTKEVLRMIGLLCLLLLPACGGIASAEELFSDVPSPLAPPPYCPQGEGTCGGSETGPIQIGSAPLSHPPPDLLDPAPPPGLDADGGLVP